jgi:CelD/BcsL family acetyltransferase involved in cellulose biosynthesis
MLPSPAQEAPSTFYPDSACSDERDEGDDGSRLQKPLLRVQVIGDTREAEAIRGEWHDLVLRAPRGELVLTPTWLLAWWREFGEKDGRKLRMLTFRDEGRLVGLAPFCLELALHRGAIPVRRLALLGSGENEEDEICSDYAGLVCDDGYAEAITRDLVEVVTGKGGCGLGDWDELLMPVMNGEDPIVEQLRGALTAARVEVRIEEAGGAPFAVLPKTWDEYLRRLPSSSRYTVTRALRELEKWGGKDGVSLVRASTPSELAEGRQILRALHSERWAAAAQTGVFARQRFMRFHDEVMPKFLAGTDAGLDLFWLTVRGEPVACVYNIVFRGKVYFYQSGRKVDVPKHVKLGIAIHALVMQRSISDGRREYDFLNGISQYKMSLATATRPLVTLRAVAPTVRGRAVDGARKLAEGLIRRAKKGLSSARPPAPEDADKTDKRDGGQAEGIREK